MFNEKMTDYIEAHFQECLKPGTSFTPSYYPHIQPVHQEKILKGFVKLVEPDETILMIFDTSLFNRGKNGLVITDKTVYYCGMYDDTNVCCFKNWRPDRDSTKTILEITDTNSYFLAPFLDKFITEICTIKEYDGLFEAEKNQNSANNNTTNN